MHVREHIEFTHKVISNTCLQSEVGIAGGYRKDWVATKPKFCFFLCPRDDSQGALRFAPVCPSVCPSVRLSVRPFVTLYGIEFV